MKKSFWKIAALSLVAGVIAVNFSRAQETTANAPHIKHTKHGFAFRGDISAVDTNAMTLTVGNLTLQITPATRITKDGQPATLADGAVGQPVSGYYRKTGKDKQEATTVRFGGNGRIKIKTGGG